ncbi:immunity 42 family protein [Pantoea sp. ACRSH]|uniref:immunity 42 family protein n=1 Tax=unclassified Pantoea TaxID=2630326 RepID=UPI001EF675BC|nr:MULTISPECIES: immunity 42 family protein [unclassified Pantoea]MCG7366320.1 immunity 42 family protein [Pantoea sp. ACRSH]MCG7396816.1 immunity 42 family protein [Pantoea sp. ACRSC]
MIYGDPFRFALQFDVVENWNEPGDIWKNGLFALYIEGDKVFDVVDSFELRTTFSFYSKMPINEIAINDLDIDKSKLYTNAKDYFLGESEKLIDGLFDMTCIPMEDNRCYLYFMKTNAGDRLVWSTNKSGKVNETVLAPGTILNVINELANCIL